MSIRFLRAKHVVVVAASLTAVLVLSLVGFLVGGTSVDRKALGIGSLKTLKVRYDQWQAAYARGGGADTLIVPLGSARMGARASNPGHGRATLDLRTGRLRVEVQGLPPGDALDVWLVHARPIGEQTFHAGTFAYESDRHVLDRRLDLGALPSFEIDRIAVTPRGTSPATALLAGSPSLFQRLYHRAGLRSNGGLYYAEERLGGGSTRGSASPFALLVPAPAYAVTPGPEELLAALIDEGERLFFEETFEGNGRTCGTCHRAEQNFALDPAFIATLPPNDPLFVAEFTPALAANFENPTLMREKGLILENVDGTDDLANKFTMRGVPHTLSMLTSTSSSFANPFGPPFDRTGWSGDGAPGAGTLRDFATGAVTQHFTKTLARNSDPNQGPVDFRLPTQDELNAMEAFQFSLGRFEDLDLDLLAPRLRSAVARQGLDLFRGVGQCNTCHLNAGATPNFAPGVNFNFDTGVESLSLQTVPRDGGLGKDFNASINAFGDGTFNTPPLVEAADTGPFFHNNAVDTIEEAVEFYTTAAFGNSPSGAFTGGAINLNTSQIQAVAAFLRVINADFNVDEAKKYELTALQTVSYSQASRLLRLAGHEIDDATRVLSERGLHPDAVIRLRTSKGLLDFAAATRFAVIRNSLINSAIAQQDVAKSLLIAP
jgi:cytochrome c peroxidase